MEAERPYLGAAGFYEHYRRRPSGEFVDALVRRLGLGAGDRVLDLGCGTASIARQLAPFVAEVVAVDSEPEMIAEARRRCADEGLLNVHCVVGNSRELGRLAVLGRLSAVTIGSAFHWMSPQDEVLAALDPMVNRVAGAVALVSSKPDAPVDVPWLDELDNLLEHYLDGAPRGWHPEGRHDPFEDILARSPFPVVDELTREYEVEEQLTLEGQVGFRYSLSWVLQQLGDRRPAFEEEAQRLLGDRVPPPVRMRRLDRALIGRRG